MSDSLHKPGLYKWKRQTDPKVYSRSQVYTLIVKGNDFNRDIISFNFLTIK